MQPFPGPVPSTTPPATTDALRQARGINRQNTAMRKAARAWIKGQKPGLVWLTGASDAENETIANLLDLRLHALGRHSVLLDAEHLRQHLGRDLGHSPEDQAECLRRLGEVARLMVDAGLIVIACCSLPLRAQRALVKTLFIPAEFVEVHLALEDASSPFERPEQAGLEVATHDCEAGQAADQVVGHLRHIGWVPW